MPEEPLTVSVDACARMLGIGRTLCYELIREGEIPAIRLRGRWVVPKKKLHELLGTPAPGSPK